ncbi:MAG: hypothetical protein WD381_02220 [Balneolaceae bacterium]
MPNFFSSVYNQKVWIVLLLGLSCVVAFSLHLTLDPTPSQKLENQQQIDSLITETLTDFNIPLEQVRTTTIEHDSLFHRKNYRINVYPGFSKTSFHYTLHKKLFPLQIETYGEVFFPEKDLRLHLFYNDTIQRSVTIQTDPELLLQTRDVVNVP